jgi:hypothetical protein
MRRLLSGILIFQFIVASSVVPTRRANAQDTQIAERAFEGAVEYWPAVQDTVLYVGGTVLGLALVLNDRVVAYGERFYDDHVDPLVNPQTQLVPLPITGSTAISDTGAIPASTSTTSTGTRTATRTDTRTSTNTGTKGLDLSLSVPDNMLSRFYPAIPMNLPDRPGSNIRPYIPSQVYQGPSGNDLTRLSYDDLYNNRVGLGEFDPNLIRNAEKIYETINKFKEVLQKKISEGVKKLDKASNFDTIENARNQSPSPLPPGIGTAILLSPFQELYDKMRNGQNHQFTDGVYDLIKEAKEALAIEKTKKLGEFWLSEINRIFIDKETGLLKPLVSHVSNPPTNFDLKNPAHINALRMINHLHLARLQVEAAYSAQVLSKGFQSLAPAEQKKRLAELEKVLENVHLTIEAEVENVQKVFSNVDPKNLQSNSEIIKDLAKLEAALKRGKAFSDAVPDFVEKYKSKVFAALNPDENAEKNFDFFKDSRDWAEGFNLDSIAPDNIFLQRKYSKDKQSEISKKCVKVDLVKDLRFNDDSKIAKYFEGDLKDRLLKGQILNSRVLRRAGVPEFIKDEYGNIFKVVAARNTNVFNKEIALHYTNGTTSAIKNGISLLVENVTPYKVFTAHVGALKGLPFVANWTARAQAVIELGSNLLNKNTITKVYKLPADKEYGSFGELTPGNRFEINIAAEDEGDQGSAVQNYHKKHGIDAEGTDVDCPLE